MRSVFMRYPNGKGKAVTFSYDDGCPTDRRLAELFDKYHMKGTFNFNSSRMGMCKFSNEEINDIFLSKGHEIAIHGAFHRPTGNLRPIESIREVLDCRLDLEEKCGRIIRGMAYPDSGITFFSSGRSYEEVKRVLTDLDIAYARSLGADNDSFRLPLDFHNWIPTAHHDNSQIMEYIDKFISVDMSEKAYHATRYPRLFYVWGHTYEFEMNNNWEHIENICKKLSESDDIWFATNIEIYEYVEGYNRLQHSADGHTIYNPSLFEIWLDVDSKLYSVKPGETIKI